MVFYLPFMLTARGILVNQYAIPMKIGIQVYRGLFWIPAFAGMAVMVFLSL
jgi:hypothetical protein